jgi:aspartyl-tRNA(Asn)/glutamyl-tRNA(Gln) amidotransferase subunit C
MADAISRDEVRKVARLARLELTSEEEERTASQLSSILSYFERLSELDTSEVPPTFRAIAVSNVTRPDELRPHPEREAMLEQAPEREDDYFRVPRIMSADPE